MGLFSRIERKHIIVILAEMIKLDSKPTFRWKIVEKNRLRITNYLKEFGPVTRARIVKDLGIPRTTCYDALMRMEKDKVVYRYARFMGRGRPPVFWDYKWERNE